MWPTWVASPTQSNICHEDFIRKLWNQSNCIFRPSSICMEPNSYMVLVFCKSNTRVRPFQHTFSYLQFQIHKFVGYLVHFFSIITQIELPVGLMHLYIWPINVVETWGNILATSYLFRLDCCKQPNTVTKRCGKMEWSYTITGSPFYSSSFNSIC